MADDAPNLFNYYRRYRWTAEDFEELETSLVGAARGPSEGFLSQAVLSGFTPTLNGDLTADLSAGMAVGPTGYLNVINEVTDLTFSPPASGLQRALVVVRPNLNDNSNITNPTNPFETVALKTEQASEVVILPGDDSSTPEYPSAASGDVVLFGVRMETGQTVLNSYDLDFEVRDLPGKNSGFHQNKGKFDDRLFPYLSDYRTLAIKPSQIVTPYARGFTYVRTVPSIYPKTSGGLYNHADTLLNFETGTISGGDEVSVNITPTIPASGNAINACVAVKFDDTLLVSYGTEGTREECYNGIVNQAASGAGSVSIPPSAKPICFALINSQDGSTVSDYDIYDIREGYFISGGGGGGGGGLKWNPVSGSGAIDAEEFGENVFKFSDDGDQKLQVYLKVPNNYQEGQPIAMRLAIYSPSTSGDVKMQTTATLIRQGTDDMESTTNQYQSTNDEIAISSPANKYREIVSDLTNGVGEINSVGVSAGDIVKVELERDSDGETSSDTADVRFIPSSTEATFS